MGNEIENINENNSSTISEMKQNLVSILGVLISQKCHDKKYDVLVEKVTETLLSLLSKKIDPVSSLDYEILNTFMEIYANDYYDAIFKKIMMLQAMQDVVLKIKADETEAMEVDASLEKTLYENEYREEILENVVRFIEFKNMTFSSVYEGSMK